MDVENQHANKHRDGFAPKGVSSISVVAGFPKASWLWSFPSVKKLTDADSRKSPSVKARKRTVRNLAPIVGTSARYLSVEGNE
jgi:hypothetical protein